MRQSRIRSTPLSRTTARVAVGGSVALALLLLPGLALAQPANDDFDNATVITALPFIEPGYTFTAQATWAADDPDPSAFCGPTVLPGQTPGEIGASTWYTFTAPTDLLARIELMANYPNGPYGVLYRGMRGALQPVGQFCITPIFGFVGFTPLTAGQTYHLLVFGYSQPLSPGSGIGGYLRVSVTEVPPPPPPPMPPTNDDFNAATSIMTFPFVDVVDTTSATTAADDPLPSCAPNYLRNTEWYAITPIEPVRLLISAPVSPSFPLFAIFTGTRGALTEVACFAYSSLFNATAGQTYYIMSANLLDTPPGPLEVHVDEGPPMPTVAVTVDPIGVVRDDHTLVVSGTLVCTGASSADLFAEISQIYKRRILVSTNFGITVECSAVPQRWSVEVASPGNLFGTGQALIEGQATICGPLDCSYQPYTAALKIHQDKKEK